LKLLNFSQKITINYLIKMNWKVPYIDFNKQFKKNRIEILSKFISVMRKGNFTLREDVSLFEKKISKFLNVKYVIGVNSGTDALMFALGCLGFRKGSEVITVGHTFIATISSIAHVGCVPIMCDISDDYNIDVNKIEKLITKKTKAIVPVHLNGRACNMKKIMNIAKKYNLKVVEDTAQSLGAKFKGKMAGTFGNLGCFSLHPLKSLGGAGDGGFVVTNEKKIYKKIYKLRNHGQENRDKISYYGFCSRLDNLQAAIINIKLKKFNSDIAARRKIAFFYSKKLEKFPLVLPSSFESKYNFDTFNSYVIRCDKQKKLKEFLKKKKIETLINWPNPIYKNKGLKIRNDYLPNTEKIVKEILSLPIYPEISIKQLNYIIKSISEFFQKKY
tara:strand:+ start:447 stop:1607 length:1161 start_codon:yes stop_codon:yes gene_type:complete